MPDDEMVCVPPGVPVEVPFDVVPWKYIVPLPPFVAVTVVLPQNVPPPLTVTVVGRGSIEAVMVFEVAVDGVTHDAVDVITASTRSPLFNVLVANGLPDATSVPLMNH